MAIATVSSCSQHGAHDGANPNDANEVGPHAAFGDAVGSGMVLGFHPDRAVWVVKAVWPGSPAAAGITVGDVVQEINDVRLQRAEPENDPTADGMNVGLAVRESLKASGAGTKVRYNIMRDGSSLALDVEVQELAAICAKALGSVSNGSTLDCCVNKTTCGGCLVSGRVFGDCPRTCFIG